MQIGPTGKYLLVGFDKDDQRDGSNFSVLVADATGTNETPNIVRSRSACPVRLHSDIATHHSAEDAETFLFILELSRQLKPIDLRRSQHGDNGELTLPFASDCPPSSN